MSEPSTHDSGSKAKPLLDMRGIDKRFPGVQALAGVDFEVRAGEIHALMGENGAGKSTLIKVLTGVHSRDGGSVVFNGKDIRPAAPIEAEALGISTVYQEINLIPYMSVAENIALGRQAKHFGFLNWRQVHRRARQALARMGIKIDVSREISSYSMAIQQMAAIARALDIEARLLILDEPTSSLDETETAELFRIMRTLREDGLGIIFITHFLGQVYEIADRITVLRNGERVGTFETESLPRLALVGKMLGKDPEEIKELERTHPPAEAEGERRPFIRAEGLGRKGAVLPMDLSLCEGQVSGFAGLLGSGRTETARMLFGIDKPSEGLLFMEEKPVTFRTPRRAIARHIGFCSEDRKGEGIIPDLSVRENIILAVQAARGAFSRLPAEAQSKLVNHYIGALNIKTPSPEALMKTLSGGNQQKVLLARWLAMESRLLILDEPTRGIDVGAKAEIEKLVRTISAKGAAVLFISSELDEIVRNCSRVFVLRDRKKIGELEGEAIHEEEIMNLIAGEGS